MAASLVDEQNSAASFRSQLSVILKRENGPGISRLERHQKPLVQAELKCSDQTVFTAEINFRPNEKQGRWWDLDGHFC